MPCLYCLSDIVNGIEVDSQIAEFWMVQWSPWVDKCFFKNSFSGLCPSHSSHVSVSLHQQSYLCRGWYLFGLSVKFWKESPPRNCQAKAYLYSCLQEYRQDEDQNHLFKKEKLLDLRSSGMSDALEVTLITHVRFAKHSFSAVRLVWELSGMLILGLLWVTFYRTLLFGSSLLP